jgi:hypothetical protein
MLNRKALAITLAVIKVCFMGALSLEMDSFTPLDEQG